MGRFQSGNEGWSGREGQPPGSSTIEKTLIPAGSSVSPQPWGNGHHGFCLGRVIAVLVGLRVCRLFHHWNRWGTGRTRRPAQPSLEQMDPAVGDSRIVLSEHLPSLVTSSHGARRAMGGMRPAGKNNRSTRRSGCHYVVPNDSVGIVDKSSEVDEIDSSFDGIFVAGNVDCHWGHVPSSGDEERNMNSVPSRDVTGWASGLTVTGVAAPVISEVASSAVFVGAEAPADLGGTILPAVAGIDVPAVVGNLPLTGVVGGSFRLRPEGGGLLRAGAGLIIWPRPVSGLNRRVFEKCLREVRLSQVTAHGHLLWLWSRKRWIHAFLC